MTEQTVCLRAKRTPGKGSRPTRGGTFQIEVPAHLARDLGLTSKNQRVIRCDRPLQLSR